MVDDRTALMSARALAPGYEVMWYTIDRVLGQGGFGITYLAHDRNLDRAVAIKEYLPTSFAYRHQDYSVKPITGDQRENFVWGLGSFLKEAQTLARFSHPNVVRVHSVFEENNTAYMVMEYEHGQNLASLYKQSDSLDQTFFEQVFFPIFDGLKEIHTFDFIHRDIKPANIYIREDGTPVLIDFGSARQTTQQQTSEITTLVSQGYTPLEQYSANYGDQGPWTDIYALAATIYEGIVGKKPEESLSRSACLMRSRPDLLERLDAQMYPGFDQQFLNAVFAGLKLEPEGRPANLEEWALQFAQGDSGYASAVDSSGFTELESDRTIKRPARPSAPSALDSFDDFDSLGELRPVTEIAQPRDSYRPDQQAASTYEPSYRPATEPPASAPAQMDSQRLTGRRVSDSHPDDILNFDDDLSSDFEQPAARSKKIPPAPVVKKKRTGLVMGALAALVLVAGGVGYLMYSGNAEQGLSVATLNTLPRPTQALNTVLPQETVVKQLDAMQQLAGLLTQAHALNPDDVVLLDTIRSTDASLLALAKQWNASKHSDIANKISAVSAQLPASIHDQQRIKGILAAANQVSAQSQILALMEDKRYLIPAGDSVLDRITAVSDNDFQQLKSTESWQRMMQEFSDRALSQLSRSEFDKVARLTEAVLTIDADDPGFNALRSHLSGS